MTVVIDTNVYLSHFRFGGLPSRVCLYCLEEGEVYISAFVTGEVLRILADKFGLDEDFLELVRQTFREATTFVEPVNPLPTLCRDPDDNYVLQLAEFVEADYLITGDKDLLVLNTFSNCRIVSPTAFAQQRGIR